MKNISNIIFVAILSCITLPLCGVFGSYLGYMNSPFYIAIPLICLFVSIIHVIPNILIFKKADNLISYFRK